MLGVGAGLGHPHVLELWRDRDLRFTITGADVVLRACGRSTGASNVWVVGVSSGLDLVARWKCIVVKVEGEGGHFQRSQSNTPRTRCVV